MQWDPPAGVDWSGLVGCASGYALVLARVLGLCMTAPGMAMPGLDWRYRIGLAVTLGAVVAPVLEAQAVPPTDQPGLVRAGCAEVLTGALLGMTAGLIVAGARSAGELVSAQAGLSTSSLFDPDSGEELTVMGRLYGWIAMAAFLAMDGPLALVRALAESYTVIPAGSLMLSRDSASLVFGQVGHALELALRAAAPPAIALVVAGIVLGWLSRTAPSLPFLALSLPIRAGIGVVLVLLGLVALAATLSTAWNDLLPAR
jgi:flagellar biosynthesis protein FliR